LLGAWYERHQRDLPWRRTRDPYAIWISEIMLQQTRVAAVIPYFGRFLAAFPNPATLAAATEEQVLTMWSGLGYYSRARNLQKAAKQIVALGDFPRDHTAILELAGIGDYTAAAIASIAFGLPHAAVDGNVRRVIVRLLNDDRADVPEVAAQLLDRKGPGRWNQAVMELGATICTPRDPQCRACPIAKYCAAHEAGTQGSLPSKRAKPEPERLERTLLIVKNRGRILLTQSSRVKGFWDLPESNSATGIKLGEFRHTITFRHYRFTIRESRTAPKSCQWFPIAKLHEIPLSTTARKALHAAAIAP
jgi:A/G-specific adenine glycosylase